MISGKEFFRLYVDEYPYVHCDTREKSMEFLAISGIFGFRHSFLDYNHYIDYGENTCYNLYGDMYRHIDEILEEGGHVVEYKLGGFADEPDCEL